MTSRTAEHTIYSGRVTNWPMIWLSTALAAPIIWMAFLSNGPRSELVVPLAVVAVAIVGNLLTATSVRTTTGPNGVVARFGAFGWPRFRYPLDRIVRAERVEIPLWMLGWGIWWSPRRGLQLTLRNGQALRLVLNNGRKVTISVPNSSAAAAALDRARLRPPTG